MIAFSKTIHSENGENDAKCLLFCHSQNAQKARAESEEAMKIGYARVSTYDQNAELQLQALQQAGCGRVYVEHESRIERDRSELKKALDRVEEGDTLVVWRLDRLGGRLGHLIEINQAIAAKKAHFQSINDCIDTSTPNGRLWFHLIGAIAEYERDLIVERTRAGIAAARANGRRGGRKPKVTPDLEKDAKALLRDGRTPKEVAERLKISMATLYRAVPGAASFAAKKGA